jgi:D-sedoheptulose 7-phosphate isomerase
MIAHNLADSARVKSASARELAAPFAVAAEAIARRLEAGGVLYACGNGGSMSDALHLVGELIGRFGYDRQAIPAVALGCNPASTTAIANDYTYPDALLREVDALVRPTDALVAISTSGNAANVLGAAGLARERGAFVLGLAGRGGGKLAPMCDVALVVPSDETPRIQEVHIVLIHTLCEVLERRLRPSDAQAGCAG